MTELEARLNRIERSLRRWRRAATGCAVLMCCVPLMGQAKPRESTELVVDHLTVRDSKGRSRVVIEGDGRIAFLNGQGTETGSIDENGILYRGTDPVTNEQRLVYLAGPRHEVGGSIGVARGDRSVYLHVRDEGPQLIVQDFRKPGPKQPQSAKTTELSLEGVLITEDQSTVESLKRPR